MAAGGSINLSGGQLACAGVPDASRLCGPWTGLSLRWPSGGERVLTNEQQERGIRHHQAHAAYQTASTQFAVCKARQGRLAATAAGSQHRTAADSLTRRQASNSRDARRLAGPSPAGSEPFAPLQASSAASGVAGRVERACARSKCSSETKRGLIRSSSSSSRVGIVSERRGPCELA